MFPSADYPTGNSPSFLDKEGSDPSSSPEAALNKEHFLDLCRRLDRLEQLLLRACGRLEVGSVCTTAQRIPSKDDGSSEALASIGEERTEKAWDAVVKKNTSQTPKAVDGPVQSSRSIGNRGQSAEANSQSPIPTQAHSSSTASQKHVRSHDRHHTPQHHIPRRGGESSVGLSPPAPVGFRGAAVRLMTWRGGTYDVVMGIVIFVNAIILGIEIQWNLEGEVPSEMLIVENVFLAVFFIDLIIRMLANQRHYLRSGWFFLESLLVVTGVLSNWILAPLSASDDDGYVKSPVIRLLMILRTLRLLRLLRALRLFEVFDALWKLCNGLLLSAKTVTCALVVVFLFTYIFACFAVEVITQSELLQGNEKTREIVETRFSSLMRSAVTLMSFANADSISSFYEPLIMQNPMLAPFFALVWLVLTVSLMNLVTAVIVEEAISLSSQDVETKRAELKKKVKSLTPQIEKLFDEMDASGDGTLEVAELDATTITIPPALESVLNQDRLADLFELLDDDGSGTVDKHEFTDGVISLALQNVPIEATQTLHLLRVQHNLIEDILRLVDRSADARELPRLQGPDGAGMQLDTQATPQKSAARCTEEAYASPMETACASYEAGSHFGLEFFVGDDGPDPTVDEFAQPRGHSASAPVRNWSERTRR